LRGEHFIESNPSLPFQAIVNNITQLAINSSSWVFAQQMTEWLSVYVAPSLNVKKSSNISYHYQLDNTDTVYLYICVLILIGEYQVGERYLHCIWNLVNRKLNL
jgi:hypothetical protein